MISATSSNSDVKRHLETSRELYPRMSPPRRLPYFFVASPKRSIYGQNGLAVSRAAPMSEICHRNGARCDRQRGIYFLWTTQFGCPRDAGFADDAKCSSEAGARLFSTSALIGRNARGRLALPEPASHFRETACLDFGLNYFYGESAYGAIVDEWSSFSGSARYVSRNGSRSSQGRGGHRTR